MKTTPQNKKKPINLLVAGPARGWQCPPCSARNVNTAAFWHFGLDITKCHLSPVVQAAAPPLSGHMAKGTPQ